jgi:hypothetical protein
MFHPFKRSECERIKNIGSMETRMNVPAYAYGRVYVHRYLPQGSGRQ